MALAGRPLVMQGGQHAHRAEHAGHDVADRRTGLERRMAFAVSGRTHQPAHPLGDQVDTAEMGVGARAAEAGDAAIDQAGVDLLQRFVTEAQSVHRVLEKILDQHVDLADQRAEDVFAAFVLQIYGDAALVAVDHHEGGRLALVGGHEAAGVVAAARPFHLDDVGAEIGEMHRRRWPRQVHGDVQHLNARERALCLIRHDCLPLRESVGTTIQRRTTIQKSGERGLRRR